MKTAVIERMSADHVQQVTHVTVCIWDFVANGIRRRLETLEVEVAGATVDISVLRPAIAHKLTAAAILNEGDPVLTETEART